MLRPLLAAAAAARVLAAPAKAATYDDDAYWAFADKMQQIADPHWNEKDGYFHLGGGGSEPMSNSMQLLTYSVAAMQGHEGPARNDHRARILADRLVSSAPFVKSKTGSGQVHAPGWVNSMSNTHSGQHLVFDAEVVDGLTYAYRAREALGLPDSTVTKIRNAIHSTARGSFWRYPTIRLNQINWYALMYSADALVTGDNTLLKRDFSLQLKHFFDGARGSASSVGNFGAGMRFHYLPGRTINGKANLDSAEYANIVLTFTRFYDSARARGMAPMSASAKQLTQQWIKRAVSGYWTHAGYMNWDSGLGFERWHQAKKLGLTQEALVGLASSDTLLPSKQYGQWAKSMLDNGFDFYSRLSDRSKNGLVDPVLFDVNVVPQASSSAYLAASRIQANAARAIDAGLGSKASTTPPPLYAYDPDIGRLAVTTPTYNTAVLPVNQNAFPYGGLDLARLYDGQQEVAANIGGRAPAAFGLMVRDVAGKRVAASQTARTRVITGSRPLRLTKAPSGAGAISSAAIGRAYAGPFSDLRATGTSSTSTLNMRVTHRFTRDWIQTNWTATRRAGTARYTADVLFPSWKGDGTSPASVVAVLRNGERVTVGSRLIPLASVAYLWVRSERSGYVVVPKSRPSGAGVHILRPSAQSSDPKPGPTAAIQIARASRFNRAGLAVRITPVHNEQEAAAAAARL
jgi:hypothetical protein